MGNECDYECCPYGSCDTCEWDLSGWFKADDEGAMEEPMGYSYNWPDTDTVTVTNADDRIARALERIADALDKLIEFYPKG